MFNATTSQGISVFNLLGTKEPLWWQYELFINNSIGDVLVSAGALVVFLVGFKLFQIVVLYRLGLLAKKTSSPIQSAWLLEHLLF